MSAEVTAAVVGGIAGVVTGGVSSLLAPWSQWGVEQRRLRRQERAALVDSWRRGFAEFQRSGRVAGSFTQDDWFHTLRPRMSVASLRGIKPHTIHVGPLGALDDLSSTVRNEIDRLAREWKV